MNRITLLVLFVFSYCVGSSQAITQRGTTAVTVQDARLFAQYNFRPPVFSDTVQANLQIGLDSCGALIFSRDINSYYFRACSPKRWVVVSSGAITTKSWDIGGNASPSSPNIGTTTLSEFDIITNGIARAKIKGTGIARSAAARNKYLMIDTTDKYLYYGDAGTTIDTTSLSNRINLKIDSLKRSNDSVYAYKNGTRVFQYINSDTVYTQSPIMSITRNDSNIIYFNADTANVWRGGSIPNLQKVTDSGNVTTNDIKANSYYFFGSANDDYGRLDYNDYSWNFTDGDSVIRATIGEGGIALKNKVSGFQFNIVGNNLTANKQYQMPNYTVSTAQILPISVNGNFADNTGNITITSGSGTVTSISQGYGITNSPNPIINTGTVTVDTATLSNKYLRIVDTTNKFVNRITRTTGKDSIIYFVSGTRFAIKDSVGTNPPASGYYGAFQDNTSQTAASINTAYAVKLNTTDLTNGVSVVNDGSSNPTRITLANTGIYNIQFSLQLEKTGGSGNMIADIWIRKNGVDIPSTTGKVVLTGSANASPVVAAWNYVLDLAAGDYIQLMWATSNVNVEIVAAVATSPHPAIPSAILTVTQQAGILAGTGITAINSLTGAAQTMVTGTDSTDFRIVSTGTSHTFNLPTASATNRGALSSANWTTFNNKIGASDTSVFQRKSIPSYTFLANNTTATANAQALPFKDTSGTYTGSIAWNGTAPTSGNFSYRWTRIGKMVTINISLIYANAGSANTQVVVGLPSDAPTPTKPAGLTAASNLLYPAITQINVANQTTLTSNTMRGMLRSNSSNNGFEFLVNNASNAAINCFITCTYFTD